MVSGIPNIAIPTINYTTAHNGKMSLPVNSSSLIYSHFEHVSGIPAPEGTQGVAISKLKRVSDIATIQRVLAPLMECDGLPLETYRAALGAAANLQQSTK